MITWLGVLAAIALGLYNLVIYPVFLSPLRKIPDAHPTSCVSPLWIQWRRYRSKANQSIHEAHEALGPVVRLGPNEISVNCVDGGIRNVYAGGFEKHQYYSFFSNFNGIPHMFSTLQSKPHAARKRMLSNIYSKSHIQTSSTVRASMKSILLGRLLPRLARTADEPIDVLQLFHSTFMDITTAFQFGLCNSSNFIQDEDTARWWLDLYMSRRSFSFWPQEHPRLTSALKRLGVHLSPFWTAAANRKLEAWTMQMVNAASLSQSDPAHPENIPVVYKQLSNALSNAKAISMPISPWPIDEQLQVASEMFDHLAAGHETSAITTTYLFHELAQHLDLQRSLRDEILTLSPPMTNSSTSLPDPKAVDALPLLHAVLMETLRLHPAIPGSQPRITPPSCTLGEYTSLPAGVRVSAQAYSLHRNPTVFPSPLTFNPARWLNSSPEQLAEMHRWFWAFGSGGRMCIGSNLAMQSMKFTVGAIISNSSTHIVDDEGIEQEDAYTAQPRGGKLILRFEPWVTSENGQCDGVEKDV